MALRQWLGRQERGALRCLASAMLRGPKQVRRGQHSVAHPEPLGVPLRSAAAWTSPAGLDSPEDSPLS